MMVDVPWMCFKVGASSFFYEFMELVLLDFDGIENIRSNVTPFC